MTVLTILNHGTANSTNVKTSEGHVLVITQISRLLEGTDTIDWILNVVARRYQRVRSRAVGPCR